MTIMQNVDEKYGDFHHVWFIQSSAMGVTWIDVHVVH
ncbi:hypothetical protein RSAG8_13918, partial [Rhizoctonia solani AG-8 WAC10335]